MKIDQGFLMAVLALFSSGEPSDEQTIAEFRMDCDTVDQTLMEDSVQLATAGARHFYDELHCSPIKVTYSCATCVLFQLLSFIHLLFYSRQHSANVSTVIASEKCSIIANRKSTTRFPTSYRLSEYVTPISRKRWLKKGICHFCE